MFSCWSNLIWNDCWSLSGRIDEIPMTCSHDDLFEMSKSLYHLVISSFSFAWLMFICKILKQLFIKFLLLMVYNWSCVFTLFKNFSWPSFLLLLRSWLISQGGKVFTFFRIDQSIVIIKSLSFFNFWQNFFWGKKLLFKFFLQNINTFKVMVLINWDNFIIWIKEIVNLTISILVLK